MSVRMQCPNPTCRKTWEAADQLQGNHVQCSGCGKSILVPAGLPDTPPPLPKVPPAHDLPPPLPSTPPPLPRTTDETKNCPGCNSTLAGKAVICIECGYDFRKGMKLQTVIDSSSPSSRVKKKQVCPNCGEPLSAGEKSCPICARAGGAIVRAGQPSQEILDLLRSCETAANLPPVADLEQQVREANAAKNKKSGSKFWGGVGGLLAAIETGVNPAIGLLAGMNAASRNKGESAENSATAEGMLAQKRAALNVLARHAFPELPMALVTVFSRLLKNADVEGLMARLKQDRDVVRIAAASSLGLLGAKARRAMTNLFEVSSDPVAANHNTVVVALVAIVRDMMAQSYEQPFAEIQKAIADSDVAVRKTAALVLARFGNADEAVLLLKHAAADSDESVRLTAQAALDRIASGKVESVEKQSSPECPKCGFKYSWNGTTCGHCGFCDR